MFHLQVDATGTGNDVGSSSTTTVYTTFSLQRCVLLIYVNQLTMFKSHMKSELYRQHVNHINDLSMEKRLGICI